MRNVRPLDRFLRGAAGMALLIAGYFWLGSPWSWVCLGLGMVLLLTAFTGMCPTYRLAGIAPVKPGHRRPLLFGLVVVALLALAAGGSYASIFFTRKLFLEDFNAMNEHYKQTLFLTGKGDREGAIGNLDQLEPAFEVFSEKYTSYRPYDLSRDTELTSDFTSVTQILVTVDPLVRTGDLHEAHLALEKVRPIFQNMFKRSGFSMLSVALVDFHDAMETILAPATAKDPATVISIYPAVSEKLKIVEAELNDPEIQDIRKALESLFASAKAGQPDALPAQGDTLKSSFVKVYLKRG